MKIIVKTSYQTHVDFLTISTEQATYFGNDLGS